MTNRKMKLAAAVACIMALLPGQVAAAAPAGIHPQRQEAVQPEATDKEDLQAYESAELTEAAADQQEILTADSETAADQQESRMPDESSSSYLSVLSEETSLKKSNGNSILSAPEQLEVVKTAYNAVTLSWSGVEGAAGYQIEYSLDGKDYTVAGKTTSQVLTYKCKKLLAGTTYQLRVCALDQSNKAGNYASVSGRPGLKKPKILNAVVSQLKAADITWKKVSGAQKYELYRKQKGNTVWQLLTATEALSYTDTDIIEGGIYLYRVRALRSVNGRNVYSGYCGAVEVSVSMPAIQIDTCEPENYDSVKLTWQSSDSVTGYFIYRSTKENGTYKKIKDIDQNTVFSYTDTDVVPGKDFYYKICGYATTADGQILTGEQSQARVARTQMRAPELTSAAANVENRTIILGWGKMEEATGFRVFRSIYPDKKFAKVADVSEGTATGYEDRSVAPGGVYYYRIRAIYKSKKYEGKSPYSNIRQGNAALGAPIGLKIVQTAADTLKISWNQTSGASSYNLYRSQTASGTYSCIARELTVTEYTDTELKDNKTCYYRVAAVGTEGEGRRSNALSFLVGGVSLNTRTLKLCVGVSKPLEASTYRQGRVVWKSDRPDIAKVDSQGMVTGVGYGTATVTATVSGKSASATVSVTPGVKNGIDVSRWQDEVDWYRVKESGIDFAFLRISNHYLEDFTFETKYQDAVAADMPLGVYCYSRAVTVQEAEEEARTILSILNGRKLDYPIALDMEDAVHKSSSMTKDMLHQMILAFKQVVEDAGYDFVLYSYLSFFNTNLDQTRLEGIDLWVANYRSLLLGPGYTGAGNVKYWQYNSGQYSGSDFHVDGITDAAGNLVEVDVNIQY